MLLALALMTLFRPMSAHAQTQAPEAELKAAIIANMLLFVEWPAGKASANTDQLSICHFDESPVAEALSRLNGKSVKGKILNVMRTNLDKAGNCHALYLSSSQRNTLTRLASGNIAALPLLIGDTPGFLLHGIMVNLEPEAGRIAFDIDLRSLQAAGLKISSKALRLARVIVE